MKYDIIAGANGFIGRNLQEQFKADKHSFATLNRNVDFKFDSQVRDAYWLASYGNYHDQTDVREIFRANVERPHDLLMALDQVGFDTFYYFSSSSVYGAQDHPLSEKDRYLGVTDYANAKITGEQIAMSFGRKHKIVIVRPFSVVGVGEQSQHLIPTLIRSYFEALPIHLDPDPVHDFIDIRDLLRGLDYIRALMGISDNPGRYVYNIGSGVQYSNLLVLRILEEIVGEKIPFKTTSKTRDYDTSKSWVCDNTKLRRLGWEPKFTLRDTMEAMVAEYQRVNGKRDSIPPSPKNNLRRKLQK